MVKFFEHKGYTGGVWPDSEAGVYRGALIGIDDTVTFQGDTYERSRREFENSVDEYIEMCGSRGKAPSCCGGNRCRSISPAE